MIKLCIFDLDGTTVNSLSAIAHFANETLSRFGQKTFAEDEYRYLAGGGAKKLWRNLVNASGAPEELYQPMMEDWLTTYEADFMHLTRPYAGITDMLRNLKALGAYTAIVTNKHVSIAEKICKAMFGNPGELLDACVSDHPGMTLKPAPDELLKLMAARGALPGETLYAGDHELDMRTGKNAGVAAVGVTWGFHTAQALLAAGADYIAREPADIVAFAKTL